jgi:hypothetical protein
MDGSVIAPHYLRVALIAKAADVAVNSYLTNLDEPIEKVEVIGRKVVVTAGSRCLTMSYSFSSSPRASGPWSWDFMSHEVRPLTFIERLKRFIG